MHPFFFCNGRFQHEGRRKPHKVCSKREVVKVLKTMMISLRCRKYSSVAMARITAIFANIEELFTVFVSHFLIEINK